MAKKKHTANRKSSQSGKYYGRSQSKKSKKSERNERILLRILIILIIAAALFFLVFRSQRGVSISENALGSLLSPVQNGFHTVTVKIRDFFTRWHNYDLMEKEYIQLSRENEQLNMQLVNAEEALKENERLKTLLDARDTYDSLNPLFAEVIARDPGPWFTEFKLNRGSTDGVSTGMSVVNGDGLVGKIIKVGWNYCVVRTIIDTSSAVSCLVQRTRDNGVMRGQITDSSGSAACFIYYLPNINSITPGDTVVTSGTDSVYPKGLKIGTVSALSLDAGSEGTYAVVNPSVNFQHLEEVFILRTVVNPMIDDLPAVTKNIDIGPTSTPKPKATATPVPDIAAEDDTFHYPTQIPGSIESSGPADNTGNRVETLIEDIWASDT